MPSSMHIVIGREGQQPFLIDDDYVSRQHAQFDYDEHTGVMTLTNLSQHHGTFVSNGGSQFLQIDRCQVSPTTDIRLGPKFTFRVGQLFQVVEGPKRVDISPLRKLAEDYEAKKLELDKQKAMVDTLRSAGLIVSISGGVLGAVFGAFIGPVLAVLALGGILYYCYIKNKELVEKRTENEKRYKVEFCCPACHIPFAGRFYENLVAAGECPNQRCKAEFYESTPSY